jgi:hypothetical protein
MVVPWYFDLRHMKSPHTHFCSDCQAVYRCRVTEPCHLYTAELCLYHYLQHERGHFWKDELPGKAQEGKGGARIKNAGAK